MINRVINFFKEKRSRCICEESKKFIENYHREDGIIIDVRSPQEYNEGHLKYAISIPDYDILKKASKVLIDKEEKIYVYCNAGMRSKQAKKYLKKLGYINVYNICEDTGTAP